MIFVPSHSTTTIVDAPGSLVASCATWMSFLGLPRFRGFRDAASFALAASYVSTRAYKPGSTPCSLNPPTPSATYISPPPFFVTRTNHASSPPLATLSGWGMFAPVAIRDSLDARATTEAPRDTAAEVPPGAEGTTRDRGVVPRVAGASAATRHTERAAMTCAGATRERATR